MNFVSRNRHGCSHYVCRVYKPPPRNGVISLPKLERRFPLKIFLNHQSAFNASARIQLCKNAINAGTEIEFSFKRGIVSCKVVSEQPSVVCRQNYVTFYTFIFALVHVSSSFYLSLGDIFAGIDSKIIRRVRW